MVKDKLLIEYLNYFISNANLDDETFIQNKYDEYSRIIGRADPLREHLFGLRNLLLKMGFVEELAPNMFFLTEKGIEARLAGGYHKYLKSKNKLNVYQKWALVLSIIAILSTLGQFIFNNFINSKDESVQVLEKRVDSLYLEFKNLNENFYIRDSDSSEINQLSPTSSKKR